MPRTLGTNLTADTASAVATPRYLIDINDNYFATGGGFDGENIVWDGNTWQKTNVQISTISYGNVAIMGVKLRFVVAPTKLSLYSSWRKDTSVTIYATAALSGWLGSNDVVQIFSGVTKGGWQVNQHIFEIEASRTNKMFPPFFGRPSNGFFDLTAPGTYDASGIPVVISRG